MSPIQPTTDVPASSVDGEMARRIRLARQLSKRTPRRVADRDDAGDGMPSKVEDARVQPSTPNPQGLAASLGRPVARLLGP